MSSPDICPEVALAISSNKKSKHCLPRALLGSFSWKGQLMGCKILMFNFSVEEKPHLSTFHKSFRKMLQDQYLLLAKGSLHISSQGKSHKRKGSPRQRSLPTSWKTTCLNLFKILDFCRAMLQICAIPHIADLWVLRKIWRKGWVRDAYNGEFWSLAASCTLIRAGQDFPALSSILDTPLLYPGVSEHPAASFSYTNSPFLRGALVAPSLPTPDSIWQLPAHRGCPCPNQLLVLMTEHKVLSSHTCSQPRSPGWWSKPLSPQHACYQELTACGQNQG